MLHGVSARRFEPAVSQYTGPAPALGGGEIAGLFTLLRRFKWLILASALLSALAVGVLAKGVKPRYPATAQILIDPRDLRLLENEVSPRSSTSESGIAVAESQVQVMASENVLSRAISQIGLLDDPEYNGTRKGLAGGLLEAIQNRFGMGNRSSDGFSDPMQSALRTLRQRTQIRRTERTYVVDVTTWSETREKSAKIANGIVQAYLEEQAESRAVAVRGAGDAITARLEGLRKNVSAAEERVARYKADRNLIGIGASTGSGTGGRLVNEQQLTEINNQLTLARAEAGRAKARYDETRNSLTSSDSLPEAVRNETLRALRTQLSTVSSQRARLGAQLRPAHPEMAALLQQEQQIRRLIAEELRRIVTAAERDYLRAKATEDALAQNLETLRSQLTQTNDAQVQLRELERDLDAGRSLYQASLMRAREAKEQSELNSTNARIISVANPPLDRSFPPALSVLVPAGLVLGAGLGGLLALLWQLLGGRRPAQGVAQSVAASSDPAYFVFADFRGLSKGLGVASAKQGGERKLLDLARSVVDAPGTSFAQKIQDLDRVLEEAAEEREAAGETGPRVVLFAPDRANPAKSAVALGLTYAAIKRGARVLLVDGDPQGRQLSLAIGCQAGTGLEDVLSGRARLADAIIEDEASHLGFLPTVGRNGFLPSPRALRRAFTDMADYDLVIIDGTPLGMPGLGQALGEAAGEILFVFGTGPSGEGDIAEAMHVLKQSTPKFRGIVLTD